MHSWPSFSQSKRTAYVYSISFMEQFDINRHTCYDFLILFWISFKVFFFMAFEFPYRFWQKLFLYRSSFYVLVQDSKVTVLNRFSSQSIQFTDCVEDLRDYFLDQVINHLFVRNLFFSVLSLFYSTSAAFIKSTW